MKTQIMWAVPWVEPNGCTPRDIERHGALALYSTREAALCRLSPYHDKPVKVWVTIEVVK